MKTCWEIRREIAARPGSGKPNGWRLSCEECAMPASGEACWERHSSTSFCCAPVHVSCDFCEIYIMHRREIAALMQQAPTEIETLSLPSLSHPQGGQPLMEKVQFNVPSLWADHHTLKVREVLAQMQGVQEVIASSAFRMVAVSFDPNVTNRESIAAALAMAGYPVAEDGKEVLAHPVPVADGHKDPAWDRLRFRVAHSDPRDIKK